MSVRPRTIEPRRVDMIKDIDFAQLYRQHLARSGRVFKTPDDWDSKAARMRTSVLNSDYCRAFVSRMQYAADDSVLDVGCGPGTIGLALAPHVARVYGLDYSQGMLDALLQNARELELNNVQPVLASWDEDWSEVPVCDIAVVSRASIVADMDDALHKLNRHARKKVYLTQLVGGRFDSREIAELLGREDRSFPDHMYIINLLYQRNIHPTLDYLKSPSRLAGSHSLGEFIQKVRDSLGDLSTEEQQKLVAWYQRDPAYAQQGGEPTRWALLSWTPPQG